MKFQISVIFILQNNTDWILLNLAGIFWRVTGPTVHAVECLRRALHFSPRYGIYLKCSKVGPSFFYRKGLLALLVIRFQEILFYIFPPQRPLHYLGMYHLLAQGKDSQRFLADLLESSNNFAYFLNNSCKHFTNLIILFHIRYAKINYSLFL